MSGNLSTRDMNPNREEQLANAHHFRRRMEYFHRNETAQWQTFRFREQPRPTLELFIDAKGKPALTLTRDRNRTITARGLSKATADANPEQWLDYLLDQLTNAAMAQAYQRCRRENRKTFDRMLSDYTARQTADLNRERKHCRQITRDSIGKTKTRWHLERAAVNRIIRNKLLDRTITEHQLDLIPWQFRFSRHPWIYCYNYFARNRKTWNRMGRQAGKTIQYYLTVLNGRGQENPASVSPEYITRRVKNDLQIAGAQWRWFCVIGGADPETIRQHTRFLTDLNLPCVNSRDAREIFGALRNCLENEKDPEIHWDHGDPCQAMFHLTRAVIRHHHENNHLPERDRRSYILRHLADALEWHIRYNQPWPPTDYHAYQRRADRWTAELNRAGEERRKENLQSRTWQSLLPEQTINDVTVKPITNGWALTLAGRAIRNCLNSYIDHCRTGKSRIFTLQQAEQPIAAMELRQEWNQWKLRQLEGSERRMPTDEQKETARIIARQYQEAWERNQQQPAAA